MSDNNKELRSKFMRRCAAEGMVLLSDDAKNLPIKNEVVSIFGRTQIDTIKGGTGSGLVHCFHTVNIVEGIENSEMNVYKPLLNTYKEWCLENPADDGNGNMWGSGLHSYPEMPLSDAVVSDAAANSEKAIVFLSRISGENSDMSLEKGDYYLADDEEAMIKIVSEHFEKVIVVLNIGCSLNPEFIDRYKIKTVLFMSQAGEESGNAVVDVLLGKVCPSGKLAMTWANKYEDYPCYDGFFGEEIIYNEGIYVGYRYFDSFGITPKYPFGFGLSYTTFKMTTESAEIVKDEIIVKVSVTNTGSVSGKEVVQIYSSSPERLVEKPYQELRAFKKTKLLAPNETEVLTLKISIKSLASYYEKDAAYILEYGAYILRVGNSSRNTEPAVSIQIGSGEGYIVTAQYKNRLTPEVKFEEFKKPQIDRPVEKSRINLVFDINAITQTGDVNVESKNPDELIPNPDKFYTLFDAYQGKCTVEDVVAQMNDEELSQFSNGCTEYDDLPPEDGGPIVGGQSREVLGAAAETWASKKYDIPTSVVADGPAGLRLKARVELENGEVLLQNCSAFPVGALLACTWDEAITLEMGRVIASELLEFNVDGLLAPGINIMKNPLCGRNFEYYSEDPFLTGKICAAEVNGIQLDENGKEKGTFATIKHLAANNQEHYRTIGNSVVSERAMREIYLKAFEIAVKEANPWSIMCSYNKLNGTYTSNRFDLCSEIVRGEWDFKGFIMTDWGGRESAPEAMVAGNDTIMPGWKISHISEALANGSIPRSVVQRSVAKCLSVVIKTASAKKVYEK